MHCQVLSPWCGTLFFWARGAATMLRSDLRNVALPDRVIVSLRPHLSDMALPDVLVCNAQKRVIEVDMSLLP